LFALKKSFALKNKKDVIGFDFAIGICLNLSMPIKSWLTKNTKYKKDK